eukprot:TRINITY_DN166_c0_g1_i6.p7 TRINITY_DN166_c0_g1~~TRINITY_DN166_c0_g1_i6.p7  ORF type:complete len:128 (-),score=10.12 TRINITY_DN166_c0_g1_i6:1119-1502(-)
MGPINAGKTEMTKRHASLCLANASDILLGRGADGGVWFWDLTHTLGWQQPFCTNNIVESFGSASWISGNKADLYPRFLGQIHCKQEVPTIAAANNYEGVVDFMAVMDGNAINQEVILCTALVDRFQR